MAQAPSLYVATPCYGGMAYAAYMRSLLALKTVCAAQGMRLQINLGGGEALISRARAGMMARFLASEASHLLFIDADIGFEPGQVFRLLAAERAVVGGLYLRKQVDARQLGDAGPPPEAFEMEPLSAPSAVDEAGFQRVDSVGAGFLLISRPAAARMDSGYPELRARLGDVHGAQALEAAMVFEPLIEPGGRYLAEHQAFCHRWRRLGGEVWVDRLSRLLHVGETAHITAGAV